MNRDKIAQIIRDLSNKTIDNGCTEAEANSATNKIDQLLKDYNLTIDEVFIQQSECKKEEISTKFTNRHPIDGCLRAIANFCNCRVWASKNRTLSYIFFGLPTDVDAAKYLYNMIYSAIETETIAFKLTGGHSKRDTTSFKKGIVARISIRLNDIIQQNKVVPSAGTSLVVVKNHKVKEEFDKLNLNLTTPQKSAQNIKFDAFNAGYNAGGNISLNKALEV
jgi:hypothetical protein